MAAYDKNHPFDDPTVTYSPDAKNWIDDIKFANKNFYKDTGVANIYKTHKPRRRTANQVFTSEILKPIYYELI